MQMNDFVSLALVWIMRLVVACFFSTGFIAYYHRLWRSTFHSEDELSPALKTWRRFWLICVSTGAGIILHFVAMTYMSGTTALFYHDLGLFVLVLPLFYVGNSIGEYAFMCFAVGVVWYQHHTDNFFQPDVLVSALLVLVILLMMRRHQKILHQHLYVSTALMVLLAALFWGTLATGRMNMSVTPNIIFSGIALFSVMSYFALRFWVRQANEDTESGRLQQLATYDRLSNTDTYSDYQERVTDLFNESKRDGTTLTLVSVDVDHFKQANDHYGHLAGNTVLMGVTKTLSGIVNDYDRHPIISRTGGEEFNIVFPNSTPEDITPIIQKCWEAVRNTTYKFEGNDISVTISVGISATKPTDATIDDTYKRADDSLYKSKSLGRDTITIDGKTMHENREHDLSETYTFYTQGIVDYAQASHPRVRNELLLRMYDSSRNQWILPENFEITHETQIALISRVLETTAVSSVAVNLTANQFGDPSVATALTEFKNYEGGPEDLVVEITDIEDLALTRRISAIYRSAGVKIYIDDVGSDNSFELVRNLLPYVDGVKFAMQNLRKTNNAIQLSERVKFWSTIAQESNLDFVLEGVETQDEAEQFYSQLGVKLMQGYYFSKPGLPAID